MVDVGAKAASYTAYEIFLCLCESKYHLNMIQISRAISIRVFDFDMSTMNIHEVVVKLTNVSEKFISIVTIVLSIVEPGGLLFRRKYENDTSYEHASVLIDGWGCLPIRDSFGL